MSEPIAMTFTRQHLEDKAKNFMDKHYGKSISGSADNTMLWHEKYGMLINFIQGMFPEQEDDLI